MFDAHMHIDSVPALGWELPVEDCLAAMDEAGIEKAVVMGITDAPAVNPNALDELARARDMHPDRLFPLARIHPWYDEAERLLEHAVVDLGFRGLKLHPVTTLDHPSSAHTLRLVNAATELGVPVLFHAGDEPLSTPLAIAEVARECPKARIIMAHMGGYHHGEEAIQVAEEFPGVTLETSAMPSPARIAEAVARVGSGRVMFGSDGPACPPRLELEKVRLARLSPADFERVTEGNAVELFEARR